MQMGETNKNDTTKFLYEALYCLVCCDQAACIYDALAWSLTQCRVFDPPDLSRGRLVNIASTCHGETQRRVLQVTFFFAHLRRCNHPISKPSQPLFFGSNSHNSTVIHFFPFLSITINL